MSQRVGILSVQSSYPSFDKLPEALQLCHRSLAHIHREEHWLLYHLPQTYSIHLSCLGNLTYGSVTDTSGRIVDYSFECFFVVGVSHQSEIGYHVFYLLTLIEAQTSVDTIWDIILTHLFLKASALGVGAIQDSEVTPVAVVFPTQSLNVLSHYHRLFLVRIGRLQLQLLTVLILREHILRNLPLITSDE